MDVTLAYMVASLALIVASSALMVATFAHMVTTFAHMVATLAHTVATLAQVNFQSPTGTAWAEKIGAWKISEPGRHCLGRDVASLADMIAS